MSRTFRSTISKDIPAYLVIPRHDAESRNTRARYNSGRTNRASLLHPLPPRSWTPHRMRVTRLCSFFSAARRTNQEAPPLLSGYLARRLAPPSGAAELAALKQSSPLFLNRLASSRPDKGGGIATLHRKCPGHFAVRYPKIYRPISSFRATTRNPEIPGHGITQDARAMRHYSTLCHPEAGPRVECGVTQCASRVG